MTRPIEKTLQNGPPSQLISHISHLDNLLKNLPTTVPLDPELSCYKFGPDDEDVKEEGMWYASLKHASRHTRSLPMGQMCFKNMEHDLRAWSN